MKPALPLALACAICAGHAQAANARWPEDWRRQEHWRKRSHAPPLPHPEFLHPEFLYPQVLPPYGSGFVLTATKTREAGENMAVARPREVAERIAECWHPPASSTPGEITLRLQFSARGDVIGQPRITYVKAGAGAASRAELSASIMTALQSCAPLRFTGSLGRAIAGYPFAIRLIAAAPDH